MSFNEPKTTCSPAMSPLTHKHYHKSLKPVRVYAMKEDLGKGFAFIFVVFVDFERPQIQTGNASVRLT